MRPTGWLLLAVLLGDAAGAWADGCKFLFNGTIVPEREQRAFIEWADGIETLYVAARSDPTAEGAVWIVPVRATANAVRAEPVDEFPVVTHYESVVARARDQLRTAAGIVATFDTGGLMCPFFIGGCGSEAAPAEEASRVERLGMVVTVVSAESRSALIQYLDAQGVKHAAADLSSLDPYFGEKGYAFVCGWVAKRGEPVSATGLKVTFPTPTAWFPLRPTRAYSNSVQTVVYIRGFVQPSAGCTLPGLNCESIFGHVEAKGVGQAFKPNSPEDLDRIRRYGRFSGFEHVTRATLSADPKQWDRDLELEPGTDQKTAVALAVLGWVGYLGPLWSAVLGAALGLILPLFTIPVGERKRVDLFAGALTGAALALTLWISLLIYLTWRTLRLRGRPAPEGGVGALIVVAMVHLVIAAMTCLKLGVWLTDGA